MDQFFVRHVSAVNPTVFPHLATILISIGIFFTAWFFVFEMSRSKARSEGGNLIFKELLISLFAALFLGFGVLFLLLSVGIYV